MKNSLQTRTHYFDYLRLSAMFAVMVLHVAAQNWYHTPVDTFEWQTFNVFDSLMRWGVPVFVMISGALFLGKEHSIKKIYKKNILRLVVALFFWSIIYALWQRFVTNEITSSTDFLIAVVNGHAHLWFIYMIIGLYMISPLLRKIVEDRKLAWYFAILSIVFSCLIPELINIINLKAELPASLLESVSVALKINFVIGFSGYFVLGHLLSTAKIQKKNERWIYILGLVSLLFTIFFTLFVSLRGGKPTADYYSNMTVNVMLMSVAVFTFFKQHLNKPMKRQAHVVFLSKCSFGAYLIHLLILYMLDYFCHFNSLTINPVVAVPLISVIIFVVSMGISAVLNKIPVVKDYLV